MWKKESEGRQRCQHCPTARQQGGPTAAQSVDNTFRLTHVCSLPTPRLPLWVFYNAGCQSPGNRNTWRHGFIWRLTPPRMNLVLISHCRFPRNTTILWLLLLTAQTSAASGPWEQAQPCSIHQTSVITSATRQKTSSGENDKVALAIKL